MKLLPEAPCIHHVPTHCTFVAAPLQMAPAGPLAEASHTTSALRRAASRKAFLQGPPESLRHGMTWNDPTPRSWQGQCNNPGATDSKGHKWPSTIPGWPDSFGSRSDPGLGRLKLQHVSEYPVALAVLGPRKILRYGTSGKVSKCQ